MRKLTRGLPQMRRLREIMDLVYRLFDRRCKTQTAVKKLAKLRKRVRRFKALGQALNKLNSPNLEKALEFLDDKLLGSTSNAVERGNRRFRKAQKSIYSVRTKCHLEERIALDMHREQRSPQRQPGRLGHVDGAFGYLRAHAAVVSAALGAGPHPS